MKRLGAKVREVSLPNTDLAIPTYYVVAPAECSSNLSRFDGVRFGYRAQNPLDLEDSVQTLAGRGLWPGGQTSNHDRHLRTLGGLLRCLLSQGTTAYGV